MYTVWIDGLAEFRLWERIRSLLVLAECAKFFASHQLSDTFGILKRHEKSELSSVCLCNLVCFKLLGKYIQKLSFLTGYLVSKLNLETVVAFIADVVSSDKVRIFL
ncbi:hypothetical protein C450_09518 [Halococcus salifodinae DSM 8989]|uniref:Uncharacterized protein n=1 Tax=Halococcus salifodinae DSM 8989 TaxID=1227456 RepID=M0N7F5_9EURY|nr:hypothetical protein C450_09518 [Halococcus salifodinae DSM 8989]